MIYTARSYAKLNLFLYVTGRQKDGYHTLCSLMTPINLYDELEFCFQGKNIEVLCAHPDVPENECNLAYKAAMLFYENKAVPAQLKSSGLRITINKKIPVGGGLGGGSSNAACVIGTLNRIFGNFFPQEVLMDMGLGLGADVPFFISGSAAIATGIGQKLEPCPRLKSYYVVICHPGVSASTANVYKNFDLRLTINQKYNIKQSLNICSEEQGIDICSSLHNDLEEPACRLYPEIRTVKEEMELLLNRRVFMTGSGSSLFALFLDDKGAQDGFTTLSNKWNTSGRTVFLTSLR